MLDSRLIEKIIQILEEEEKIFLDLQSISEKKRDLIVASKVTELEKLVRLEQALIIKNGSFEDEREKVMELVAKQLALQPSEITLSLLAQQAGEYNGKRLKICQDRLNSIVKSLKNTNDLNSKLIKNSLEYIDFSINLMSSIDNETTKYGNDGQYGQAAKRTFFDMKL